MALSARMAGRRTCFVHYSAIQAEGYRNLEEGQRVEFSIEDTPKGPQAAQVVDLGKKADEPAVPAATALPPLPPLPRDCPALNPRPRCRAGVFC